MGVQKSELDPQDQRKTSSMEDSPAITIEFLRARLLSERSVSRSARQRADELAEKVMELEEHLRMVTLQRKMAEKAAADVLAILENQGISDVSEEFDLGSDLEMPCESGLSNDSAKEGERSRSSSKGRRRGLDEHSGSDVDSSPVPGRSLSWKGRLHSSRSLEKYKTSDVKRRSSFSSLSSSPKQRPGKSCRQIRHRETRLVVEESRDKPVKVGCLENEAVSSSEGFPNCSNGGSKMQRIESEIREEDQSVLKLSNKNHDVEGYEREKDIEKALEHQAQLIGRYEAMEKAQREWEEKFRENNGSTPDSCDMGNHSDVTEERDESKAKTTCSGRVVTSNSQEDKSEARGVCLSEEMLTSDPRDNITKSYDDTGYNNTTGSTSGLLGQENSPSLLKGSQNRSPQNNHSQSSDRHQQGPHWHDHPDSKPTDSDDGLPLNYAARNKNDLSELVSHGQSRELTGVLESLKEARLTLQQELNRLPVSMGQYTGKAIKPLAPASKTENRSDIPVGYSGLFRLPTDFSDEATARLNVPAPTSGLSSNFYLDRGIPGNSGGEFGTNPYTGAMLRFSANDQSFATGYSESGSRFDTRKDPFVPFMDGVLSSSSKTMWSTYPIHSSYQNATPQMSFGDGPSRPYPSSTFGVPPAYNFRFHGDHV